MAILPPKIKRNSGKADVGKRSPGHRAWVRLHACVACGGTTNIEAAHVRTGTGGGMGLKPSDIWVVSMCADHHREQHQIGEPVFEQRYGIDLKMLAQMFIRKSPHKHKLDA